MMNKIFGKVIIVGIVSAFCVLHFSFTASAYTEKECTSPGVGGICAVSCIALEKTQGYQEVGTCSDNLLMVSCCSKKKIPEGGSLEPTPAGGTSPAATGGGSPGSAMTLFNPLCPKDNPNCEVTLNSLIGRFVAAFLGMVGALALLVFVYAGVIYMTAGSSDRIKEARDTMKYAVLGLGLIVFAYVLTNFFFNALTSSPPTEKPASKPVTLPTQ